MPEKKFEKSLNYSKLVEHSKIRRWRAVDTFEFEGSKFNLLSKICFTDSVNVYCLILHSLDRESGTAFGTKAFNPKLSFGSVFPGGNGSKLTRQVSL